MRPIIHFPRQGVILLMLMCLFLHGSTTLTTALEAAEGSGVLGNYCWRVPLDDPGVSYMGRVFVNRSGAEEWPAMSVDHPGTGLTLGLDRSHTTWQASAGFSVQMTLSVKASNDVSLNQPHIFGVYVFSGEQYRDDDFRPPALELATSTFNFSTFRWTNDALQNITLYSFVGGVESDPTLLGGDNATFLRIWILKHTEAAFNLRNFSENFVTFHDLHFCGNESMHAKEETGGKRLPLRPAVGSSRDDELPRRRIEFLGDSLTAGYCNLCGPSQTTFRHESFVKTWGYLTAQHFNAQYHAEAWSGFGMVRNCCGGNVTMPHIFNRALATLETTPWNFSQWAPQILMINLGSNDNLPRNESTEPIVEEYMATYESLVLHAIEVYANANGNGTLHVILACGPIVPIEGYCQYLPTVAERVTKTLQKRSMQSMGKLHLLHFANLPLAEACCYHPSAAWDAVMAKQVIRFIEQKVGWR